MAKVEDKVKATNYLKGKGHKQADIDRHQWETSAEIIESVVKLHGSVIEGYHNSGLG